ncbi:MAG: class I SAM-dependent methyltransferase [Burkholderiales bacterium]
MLGNLLGNLVDLWDPKKRAARKIAAELIAARDLLDKKLHEKSIERLSALLARHPDNAEALFLRGTARLEIRLAEEALKDLLHAKRLNPTEPRYCYNLAVAQSYLGDAKNAIENCRVAAVSGKVSLAHGLWASMELPGEEYFTVMQRIHDHLRPRTYVEVGVFQGKSLRLALAETLAIGIDPEPKLEQPPGPRQTIHATTSDAYFAEHDVITELGGERVQMAFIDGMHHFEFALRDFINVEKNATPNSVVLIHDCYPLERETANRERTTGFWSGDIWRLIVLLKKYRQDLAINVIGTPPTGLGVVQHLDPNSTILSAQLDEIIAEFMALDYAYLDEDKAGKLNLFPNEWPRIEKLLPAAYAS